MKSSTEHLLNRTEMFQVWPALAISDAVKTVTLKRQMEEKKEGLNICFKEQCASSEKLNQIERSGLA